MPNDVPTTAELWQLMPWGYLLTIVLETPVLLVGLSSPHPLRRRLFAGLWLTACTYPIVAVLLPLTVWAWWGRIAYLAIAETFAPLAECALFLVAFPPASNEWRSSIRDCAAIVVANLVSFLLGGYMFELMR